MNESKAILICGKICSGKSYYAKQLAAKERAIILSCDELMLTMFHEDLGKDHDTMTERAKEYLYNKSLEILEAGCSVILEWGFWTKEWRLNTRRFYESKCIKTELHYVDISDADWHTNIKRRNSLVKQGKSRDYYLDEGLMRKLEGMFTEPCDEETDVIYHNIVNK